MNILVVGGGGREHALMWALHRDLPDATLYCAPGNPGTATLGRNLPFRSTDVDALVMAAVQEDIDVTVVGPEAPLAAGLADRLRERGRMVFGPSRGAARIEASKAFAKNVMESAGVPTAPSRSFSDLGGALQYINTQDMPIVVKASGLAAGKGVAVCTTREDARSAAQAMLLDGRFGDAGREVVIERFLPGEELSVLAMTDGEQVLVLPPAQDHKRLGEADTGPNTGGMGAYCPVSIATPDLIERVRREVFEPTLTELSRRGSPFQGVLYAGLMIAPDGGLSVLEFNCRFGDPETEAVLPALAPGASQHLLDIARGAWRPRDTVLQPARAAVTTVLAAPGYPDRPQLGAEISLAPPESPDVIVFHAGTERDNEGRLRVQGGRVLAVTGLGASVPEAARRSREASAATRFQGKLYRGDIGWREIRRAGAA